MNGQATEILSLSQSRIELSADSLIQRNPSGQATSEIALSSIQDVSLQQVVDGFAVGVITIAASGAVAAWMFIPAKGWGIAAAVVLGLIALIGLAGLHRCVLKIKTDNGDVSCDITDSETEANGFVISLRERVRKASEPPVLR